MIDKEDLDAELRAALPNCTGYAFRSTSPGVPSGTVVETVHLWIQKSANEWVDVIFTGAPSASDQSTAASVVTNHAPSAVQLMRAKMRAGGLEPPALWAWFVKNDTATWNALTVGQRSALNGLITAGLMKAQAVIQA